MVACRLPGSRLSLFGCLGMMVFKGSNKPKGNADEDHRLPGAYLVEDCGRPPACVAISHLMDQAAARGRAGEDQKAPCRPDRGTFVMALTHLAGSDLLAVLPRRLVRQHAALHGLIAVELPIKRKFDPIHALATRAAMMDAGVAWLMQLFAELHAPQRCGTR
jgi:DNA-binding transcriptional LysR family regulator